MNEKDALKGNFPVNIKELVGRVDNSPYPEIEVNIIMILTTPVNTSKAVPVVVELGWNWPAGFQSPQRQGCSWEEQLLEEGWGYAILISTSFQADNGAGLTEGIIGLANRGQPRELDDWGTLRAWA